MSKSVLWSAGTYYYKLPRLEIGRDLVVIEEVTGWVNYPYVFLSFSDAGDYYLDKTVWTWSRASCVR